MKKPQTYRDLDYNEVVAYADKIGLNSESLENFREVAIMLFNEKYSKRKAKLKKSKGRKK